MAGERRVVQAEVNGEERCGTSMGRSRLWQIFLRRLLRSCLSGSGGEYGSAACLVLIEAA